MEQVQTQRRIAKPIGLYIITAFDFIAVGLIPLVTVIFAARNSDSELPFFVIAVSVGLPVLVMAATIWAWFGDNVARYLLLGLITLMSVLLILNNVILISGGEASGDRAIPSVGIIVRASFWIVINWWYFNRGHVVRYFKQNLS
jgi:cadmium resistance protein CadD (predicted permease)